MAAIDKVRELTNRVAQLRQQAIEESKAAFDTVVKELFEENPTLVSFSWNQYTPYFMDGEPCEFGVNSYEPDVNDESGWEINKTHELYPLQQKVVEFIDAFDTDALKAMFGDHADITVTKDGASVTECTHD